MTSCISLLCWYMVVGMSVMVNVMWFQMSVMSPPPGSKRHSIQEVELSQRSQTVVQIVSNLPAQFTVFWASQPCGPAR